MVRTIQQPGKHEVSDASLSDSKEPSSWRFQPVGKIGAFQRRVSVIRHGFRVFLQTGNQCLQRLQSESDANTTIPKIFRTVFRPTASFSCNPTDRETWFASSENQSHESSTILMFFEGDFTSLSASRVVQGVEANRFKTSAMKATLKTFFGPSFGQIA